MGDLAGLYSQARRLILSLRDGVEQLERSEQVSLSSQTTPLSRDLTSKLADLQRISAEMDTIWRMQVVRETSPKRDVWKRKVEQVAEDADSLKLALEKHMHRTHRKAVEEQNRAELLGARGSDSWRRELDEEAAVQGSVRSSARMLEEAYHTGTAVLTDMAGQRERLKAAHRKALDVLNGLGLSDSLLRLIERRQKMDKYVVYGGMALTTLLILFLVFWVKR